MKRWSMILMASGVVGAAVASLATFGATTGCNTGTDDCPDKAMVVAGGSCSDNHLQCAYDLMTPAAECDGTNTVIETSCTCTDGTWVCPDPFACDSGAPTDEAGMEAGDEAGMEAGDMDSGDSGSSGDSGDSGDAHD